MAATTLWQANAQPCNCSFSSERGCKFDANPDIAGIGVLLSFIISTCMTYATVVAAYFFVQTSYREGTVNKLDSLVEMAVQRLVTYVARPFRQRPATVSKLARISAAISDSDLLYKILLALTDQQLITGMAIMIAGYAQTNSISLYHFSIVQNMATLSFTSFGAAADMLEDNVLRDPVMRTWRGVAIICFQLMTLATFVLHGHSYWMANYGMPITCLWKNMRGNYSLSSLRFWNMVLWGIPYIRGIVSTLYAYFPLTWVWVHNNTKDNRVVPLSQRVYNRMIDQSNDSLIHKLLTWFWWPITILEFILIEILQSQAIVLQLYWFVMVSSIYSTFELRSNALEEGRAGDEDTWGFGQAVPMFLLILPLALIWEKGYDAYIERSRQVTRYHHPQHHSHPSAFPETLADMRPTTNATYAVVWEAKTHCQPTCWISSVEVTSHLTSHASDCDFSHPDITQRFSPGSASRGYARVFLENTGKRVRFSGAGDCSSQTELSNKRSLEDKLYQSFAFRTFMLGLLLASLAGMTILGISL